MTPDDVVFVQRGNPTDAELAAAVLALCAAAPALRAADPALRAVDPPTAMTRRLHGFAPATAWSSASRSWA